MARVAFFGIGVMGEAMATRLLAAGHGLAVYNRTAAKATPLVKAGARPCRTPAEAAEGADLLVSMVADDDASRAVWLGPDGALAGALSPGATAVESATVSWAWMKELSEHARAAGLAFLDCPVTGGPDGARDGKLTLLAGGEKAVLDAAWPTLRAYAARAFHFGPAGAGTAYKLVVNTIGAAQAVALAEGLLVAEKAGLSPALVAEAMSGGAVASPLVRYLLPRMTEKNHDDVYFAARWRLKDAACGLALAKDLNQRTSVLAAAEAAFRATVDDGLGDKNSSVVIEALRKLP
ncbi:MAG: NAD(P)-dependent oxidoreductase [Rhodospirillales bacterium]|nr:NAD(P)-dependent oxidoreductase [Rhodospirillales bacterium]